MHSTLSFSSLVIQFMTNLFKPWERNSDQWIRIVFVHRLILIFTPYLHSKQQVVNSNANPVLVFPRIQPFESVESASVDKVCSRLPTVNCENSSVSFVMKILVDFARFLESNRVCTMSQSWLRTKKLWDAFKTAVGSKHDVTVEVPLRSTRRRCYLTLQRQKQRQRRKAHLRVCACATLGVTSPTTSTSLKHSNFLNSDRHKTRIVQLLFTWRPFSILNFHSCRRNWRNSQVWMHWEVHTLPLAKLPPLAGCAGASSVCVCRFVETKRSTRLRPAWLGECFFFWKIITIQFSFVSSSSCHVALPFFVRQMMTKNNMTLTIIFSVLLNLIVPLSRSSFFDTGQSDSDCFLVQQSKVFLPIGTVLEEKLAESRFFVVLLDLWSICNINCIQFWRIFLRIAFLRFPSSCRCRLYWFIQAVRNSDQWMRNVIVHGVNLDFHSCFTLWATGCNFQCESNFGVPSNSTFRINWICVFWQGVFTIGHQICELWEFFSVFRHENTVRFQL